MTTNKFDVLLPEFTSNGGKVILEYVFVTHKKFELASKTRVVDFEPKCYEECPLWDSYMLNDVRERPEDFQMMILKPVAMFENPFFKSPHKLVLCDLWLTLDKPSAINTRYSCKKTMDKLGKDPATGYEPKVPHEPWFGIEQEYCVTGNDGFPISYDPDNNDYASLLIFQKIGHPHSKNIGIERELSNRHLMACIYAGIQIHGYMRENGPSQWEFQIGPCPGESIGDHLNMARYILHRLAEMFGLRVTFHPVPVHGEAFLSSGHLNFSTRKMREKGGIKFIRHAIDMLSKSDQDQLLRMYDPTIAEENKERLLNETGRWHPRYDEFLSDVANKELTTIRIPPLVNAEGCGYFEDRRPSSAIDPYAAAEGIVRACIFGEFLKPMYEYMKDLSVWDKD